MRQHVNIWTDGGSRGNPGPAGAGVVIRDDHSNLIFAGGYFLGEVTNNVAEYAGLIKALEQAVALGAGGVTVRCDSNLLVQQINGKYRVKNAGLKPLFAAARELLDSFEHVDVRHVYREENAEADRLANKAMDAKADVGDAIGTAAPRPQPAPREAGPPASEAAAESYAAVDLPQVVRFGDKPQRLLLHRTERLTAGAVCLNPGQTYQTNGVCLEATLTVMRGSGAVHLGKEKIPLRAGAWLHVGPGKLRLAADSDGPFVVLITAVNR